MKFGHNLARSQNPEWASAYINYKGLKKLIKSAAAAPEPDLAEFFFSLDRNLEDVDAFYNKKYSDATRRLKLLQEHDDADELMSALLELRNELRTLRNFGNLNRQGFIKITKKMDKKVRVCVQQPYISSKVDTKPFATNTALEATVVTINEFMETVQNKPKSIHSKPSMTNLPNGVLGTVDRAVRTDDIPTLKEALLSAEDDEVAMQKLQIVLLQRSIANKSKNCIDYLLKQMTSLDDPDDINERNCIHRLVISIGRSNKDTSATTPQFIQPAAHPVFGVLSSTSPEAQNAETVLMLTYVLDKFSPQHYKTLVSKDSSGRIPLHYAAQFGLVRVCELLVQRMQAWGLFNVENGIDAPEWQDNEGMAPLHLSVIGGHPLTTQALLHAEGWLEKAATRNSHSSAVLALAVSSNFVTIVQLLVDAGVDINWQDKKGETALHVAARFGFVACAKALLEGTDTQKADVELVENAFAWAPIHIAAVDGHAEIIELLIAAGADLNKLDASGWTAREHAALRGHMVIAERLAEAAPWDSSSDSEDSNSTAASTPPQTASLEERRSKAVPRTTTPVKTFGHRYLTNESMILVSLGSMDMRKDTQAVKLDVVPIGEAHTTQLDTTLSVVVSATGASGDSCIIDLPVNDNISTEPMTFMSADPSKVKLMFDIVPTYSGGGPKYKVGRAVALLSSIKATVGSKRTNLYGDLTVPIVSADTLEVIGTVNFNFLVITPFSHPRMEITEKQTYWKSTSTMVIGHRGLGKNMNSNRSLQLGENTIQSFIAAANLGANYVEFDVQLTKDHVPVIYHDFLVSETGIDAPVHALTLEQFLHINREASRSTSADKAKNKPFQPLRGMDRPRSLSLGYPLLDSNMDERMKHTRDFKEKGFKANSRGHFIQAPFTTLEEMFKKLPENVGFNIEMKYPMLSESEDHDMDAYAVELNSFCDTVLTKVYDLGEKRNIIFSSFNPDVCLVLSFKQPSIPILFLTDAGTCPVGDIRASSLQEAIRFASRWNLLGVVSAAEPLCNSPRLVKVVKENGLVCVSYGSLNNDPEHVRQQVKEGIDAVIVDSVLKIRKGLQEGAAKKAAATPTPEVVELENGVKILEVHGVKDISA